MSTAAMAHEGKILNEQKGNHPHLHATLLFYNPILKEEVYDECWQNPLGAVEVT